jgi:hypothetical protein
VKCSKPGEGWYFPGNAYPEEKKFLDLTVKGDKDIFFFEDKIQ